METVCVTMMLLYGRSIADIWRSSDVKATSTQILEFIDISTGNYPWGIFVTSLCLRSKINGCSVALFSLVG
jgi:hypothetical protein